MRRRIVTIFTLVPLLAGCAVTPAPDPTTASQAPSGASTSATPAVREGVPGYALGEFPPVPQFVMPDLSMLDSAMAGFSIKVRDKFPTVPGVTIRPARCDKSGTVETDSGTLQLYGDGSGTYAGPDGKTVNYGDGSGNYTINGKKVTVYGDGSGNYDDGRTKIVSYGDGSGNYTGIGLKIVLYGDGSGNYTDKYGEIVNYGDGSGNYTSGNLKIINYGDGSGNYDDGNIKIVNYGDRTGTYSNASTGEDVAITPEPIAPVAKLGIFPKMGTLKPIKSCGTRIIIGDSVMFDFNKDTLRPAAKDTMAKLAALFKDLKIKEAIISGHTDAIGTDTYNQDLSERRANAVRQALLGLDVTTTLEAKGYGETKPIAPNELNGKDNPAGRQANRRVEIFIPNGG